MKTITMIKSFTAASLIALCSNGFAMTSTQIALGGGNIAPKGELAVSLTQLIPGVDYKIQCGITASAATKMHFALEGAVFLYQNVIGKLNGTPLSNSLVVGATGAVSANENTLLIASFTRSIQFSKSASVGLRFINLDDTVTETVHNCFADPI